MELTENFIGKLAEKTIYDFKNQLDYSLKTQKERLELLKNIMNDKNGFPHPFFLEYFEQKEDDNGLKISHFKTNILQKDCLSEDINVCKELEKMADYILFAPDAKPLTNKPEYNCYSENIFKKKLTREPSLDETVNKIIKESGEEVVVEVLDCIVHEVKNYKLMKKQKINDIDLIDEELRPILEYEQYIVALKEKIKQIEENGGSKRMIYMYRKHISQSKQDQVYLKDSIKGTIYLKFPEDSNEVPDYLTFFSFSNTQHIKALLKIGYKGLNTNIGHLVYDLENIISRIKLSTRDKRILELWRKEDKTEKTIANIISCETGKYISQPSINKILMRITRQIAKEYNEMKKDWLHLNYFRGKYKKCSKCKKIKIVQCFDTDKSKKDGLKTQCKKCRKITK